MSVILLMFALAAVEIENIKETKFFAKELKFSKLLRELK